MSIRTGLLLVHLIPGFVAYGRADITLENDRARWVIGADGTQRSFFIKSTGTEAAHSGKPFPVASLHNAAGWHAATSVTEAGDILTVGFADGAGSVCIRARAESDHFFLELQGGVPDGTDRLILAQTSLTIPEETIGTYWPMGRIGDTVVAFAALSPVVRNRFDCSQGTVFVCEAMEQTGFDDIRLAIVVGPENGLLDTIEALELRYGLPHLTLGGTWFRKSDELRQPYLFTDLTEANVDEIIRFAKRGGFGYVLTFRGSWSTSNGHYAFNPRTYPNSEAGLKAVADKLHAAGLKVGIHLLSACISRNDRYVRPVPDKRLAVAKTFTLEHAISADDSDIPIDASPAGMTKEDSYASRGCDLWIDDEILSYRDYTEGHQSFAFTKCLRGQNGTTAAAHQAGAAVRYLHRMYNFYLPDTGSDLLPEIAERIATICNQCGIDMIYFDGGEAINRLGRGWHDSHWVQREVAKRLNRDVLITGSGGNGGFGWHTHMRGVSNDGVNLATKLYLDRHKIPQRIMVYGRSLAAAEMGWLNLRAWDRAFPPTQPDEWEYFCLKALAYDSPVSLHMDSRNFHENGRAGECLDIIRRYEQARRTGKFSPGTLAALRELGKEYELFGDERAGWHFRPLQVRPAHLVCPDMPEGTSWTVSNPYADQPLSARIRCRPALQPFGHEANVVLLDPADDVDWDTRGRRGAKCTAATSVDCLHDGKPSLKLTGMTTRDLRGSRAWARREFSEHVDLTECRSLGLWVHGDGNGEVLDIQLIDRSLIRARDHLVHIDFTGWRYIRLVEPATEETFDYDLWSLKRNLVGFQYEAVRELRLQLVAMPKDQEVKVHIGRLEALREQPHPLTNPVLDVNGQGLAFPVRIAPDEMLELQPDGTYTLFDRDNRVQTTGQATEPVPVLRNGTNRVLLRAEAPFPFVRVTPVLHGDKTIR